jgi:hypothetical protein
VCFLSRFFFFWLIILSPVTPFLGPHIDTFSRGINQRILYNYGGAELSVFYCTALCSSLHSRRLQGRTNPSWISLGIITKGANCLQNLTMPFDSWLSFGRHVISH